MSVNTLPVDVATLSDEEVAALLAGLKSRTSASSAAAKADREAKKLFVAGVVNTIVEGAGERAKFQSGAEGWSLGGKFTASDGNTYKVSILLRDVETIPVTE